jgi:hypothetical protein
VTRRTGVARNPLRAGEKLEIRIDQQLNAMQKNRGLVSSFFELAIAIICSAPQMCGVTSRSAPPVATCAPA